MVYAAYPGFIHAKLGAKPSPQRCTFAQSFTSPVLHLAAQLHASSAGASTALTVGHRAS